MPRPAWWYSLFRGKVWHLGWADAAAACGSERPADAETVGERAPINARVCVDCVASALHLYGLAQAAQRGDPRMVTEKASPVALPVTKWACGGCGHLNIAHWPDSGACSGAADESAPEGWAECHCYCLREPDVILPSATEPDEWPCGSCGHANVDHDCDDGTCWAYEATRESGRDEQCECRGLTKAGGEPVQLLPVDDELAHGDEFEYGDEDDACVLRGVPVHDARKPVEVVDLVAALRAAVEAANARRIAAEDHHHE